MRILDLELMTSSLEEIRDFYSLYLGFDAIEDNDDYVAFKIGYSVLRFRRSEQNIHPYYHFALAIPNNKYKEAKRWLQQRTELIKKNGLDEFKFGNGSAEAIYFYDIAGNIVEFIIHHDLNNATDQVFAPESILGVCEIGLPSEDVPTLRKLITDSTGLQPFNKWNNNEQFAAMGNDEGLLVLVAKKRLWFPTIIQAASFDIKATVETGQQGTMRTNNIEIISK